MELLALVPLGALVLGIGFAVFGIRNYKKVGVFEQRAVRVPGTVTGIRTDVSRGHDGNRHVVDFPTVRFALADGREIETETMYGSRPLPVKVGQQVTVLHDPDDPHRVTLPGALGTGRLLWGIFIGLGFFFAAMGLFGIGIAVLVLLA